MRIISLPEPSAGVNENATGGYFGEGANSVNKILAPRRHVLSRVQRRVGGCNFDVEHHDLSVAERADGVNEVHGDKVLHFSTI